MSGGVRLHAPSLTAIFVDLGSLGLKSNRTTGGRLLALRTLPAFPFAVLRPLRESGRRSLAASRADADAMPRLSRNSRECLVGNRHSRAPALILTRRSAAFVGPSTDGAHVGPPSRRYEGVVPVIPGLGHSYPLGGRFARSSGCRGVGRRAGVLIRQGAATPLAVWFVERPPGG